MPFELLPARTSSKFGLQVIFSLSGCAGPEVPQRAGSIKLGPGLLGHLETDIVSDATFQGSGSIASYPPLSRLYPTMAGVNAKRISLAFAAAAQEASE